MATTLNNPLTTYLKPSGRILERENVRRGEVAESRRSPVSEAADSLVCDFSADEIQHFEKDDAAAGLIIGRALCGIFSVSVVTSLIVIYWTFFVLQR